MTKSTQDRAAAITAIVARLKGQAEVVRHQPRNEKGHYCGSAQVKVIVTGHPVRDQWARQYLKGQLTGLGTMQRTARGSGRTEILVA